MNKKKQKLLIGTVVGLTYIVGFLVGWLTDHWNYAVFNSIAVIVISLICVDIVFKKEAKQ